MSRIGLEEMSFYAYHGYYPSERKIGNHFLLDVFVNLKKGITDSDDIHDTVNYENIYAVSKTEMEKSQKLLETVVYNIGKELKKQFPIIDSVDIRLKKTSVQLGGKIGGSVIEAKI